MGNNIIMPFFRTENLVVKELPGELLIYDLENNKAYCLNETARMIMDECDGSKSVDEARKSLNHKLKSALNEDMIWLTIEQFKKFNFIRDDFSVPIQTTRISRRKILQASAALGISLPIITSLIAPLPVHAQSGCIGNNQPCLNEEDTSCCPGATCVNVEAGPTGYACIGICIPLGNPCTVGGTACCGPAFCAPVEGVPICVPVPL
jgi:hypothetical protein